MLDMAIKFLSLESHRFREVVASCFVISVTLCLLSFLHGLLGRKRSNERSLNQRHGISIHRTQILKCNISHYRLFPEKHRFVYPYLSVGIPVRSPSSNWLLSIDEANWWKRGWFHVTAKDHLDRGSHGANIADNLDEYLKQQSLDPATFPHVYLLTSARFLNCKFSPASFWYLYTKDFQLKYVIAEVNNTFDERRMYLFRAPQSGGNFEQTVAKDFHVSPFNSRKGSYILATTDPVQDERISVTVTLRSSKNHPKLVARWWSTEPAIDPSTYPRLCSLWLLGCWGWTALVTFPRVVFHAILLAHVHKLCIWYRPEPRESAIPRQATSDETLIASIFMRYMRHLHEQSREGPMLSVCSKSPPQSSATNTTHDVDHASVNHKQPIPELRIHAPQFYRQVISYPNLVDFLRYTLLDPHTENHTAWSNDSERLIDCWEDMQRVQKEQLRHEKPPGIPKKLVWAMYERLQTKKQLKGAYPYPGLPRERSKLAKPGESADLSSKGERSDLDEFVFGHCEPLLQGRYMRATLSLQWRTRVMGAIGGE